MSDTVCLSQLVPVRIICFSEQILLDLNTVRDRGSAEDEDAVVAKVKTFVTLHKSNEDHVIGGSALNNRKHASNRLVVAGRGLSSDFGRNIYLGGLTMLLKVVTDVLKEYSGLDYQSEVFCPQCIQNEGQLADVKSFEKETVESNLNLGMDGITCGCKSNIDIRWLLPGAARVLEKRNKKVRRGGCEECSDKALQILSQHGSLPSRLVTDTARRSLRRLP